MDRVATAIESRSRSLPGNRRALGKVARPLTIAPAALCALIATSAFAASSTANNEQAFPYVAYVTQNDAEVRSGPDEKHYPTQRLPAGFAMEVYRHDRDGWCAIRPPEGAFSLIDAGNIRLIDANLAEVVRGDAPSRVGSAVADKQNAVQVLLGAAELVEVLQPVGPADRWVKIAPPSGEFRWMPAKHLSRTPPVEGAPSHAESTSRWSAQSPERTPTTNDDGAIYSNNNLEFRSRSAPKAKQRGALGESIDDKKEQLASPPLDAFAHLSADPQNNDSPHAGDAQSAVYHPIQFIEGSPAAVRLAQHERPAWADQRATSQPPTQQLPNQSASPTADATLSEASDATTSGTDDSQPPADSQAPAPTAAPADRSAQSVAAPAASSPPRTRFRGYSTPTSVDARIFRLQLQLSQLIVQPPANWQWSQLRSDVNALMNELDDPGQKKQLDDMLARIDAFESAQVRYTRPWTLGGGSAGAAVAGENGATSVSTPNDAGGTSLAMSGGQAGKIRQRVQEDLANNGPSTSGAVGALADNDVTPTPPDPFVGASTGDTMARYDAVGTLKPVVSKRQQAPRYALVDDEGLVIAFLTPRPDLNLQRFIGQRIGVHGSRGFMPEFRRAHVTASRITPLNDALIR